MKKIIFTTIAALLTILVQAQTCKVSSENGKKVIQISVNLDSLNGKTLVTSIKNIQKDSVVLDMTIEEETEDTIITVAPCEDSSEVSAVNENEEVDSIDVSQSSTENQSMAASLLNGVGLGEIGNLIGALTNTNGEPYAEYMAKKLTQADSTYTPQYKQRKWKWLDNYISYTTFELSGGLGQDFGESSKEEDEISSEDYGASPDKSKSIGGSAKLSQVFIHGHYDSNGNFVPNTFNFGWSIGAIFAMDHQKDYGWSWDILAKLGIQGGNGITLGADILFGGGSTPYAVYSTNMIDYRVAFHNQWCFKYGAQAWVSMNYGGNTYTSLFARIVKSVAPASLYNLPTAKGWNNEHIDFDEGSWDVGFAIGYKFGSTNIKNRRLQATVSTGYNLCGGDKGLVLLYELEKFSNLAEHLNFSYGFGYEQSLSGNELQSFMLNCGWLFKLKEHHKISCLAKVYAGIGEYMVNKLCVSENQSFKMDTQVKQICGKAGVHLGASYCFGCNIITLGLRGGYHLGLDNEFEGYKLAENSNLYGIDLTPMLGYTLNF